MDCLSELDSWLITFEIIRKAKIYLKTGQHPPKGYTEKTGPLKGRYYDTDEHPGTPAFRKKGDELHHRSRVGIHGPGTYKITIKDGLHHLTFTSPTGETKHLGEHPDLKTIKQMVKDAREGVTHQERTASFEPADDSVDDVDVKFIAVCNSPVLRPGKYHIREFGNELCLDFECRNRSHVLMAIKDTPEAKERLQKIADRLENLSVPPTIEPDKSYAGPMVSNTCNREVRIEYIKRFLQIETTTGKTIDINAFFPALDRAVKKLLKDSVPCIRVKRKHIPKILKSGFIKNQLETGTSSGSLVPQFREEYESKLYSLPEKTPVSEYPKYGYLAHITENNDNQHNEGKWLDQYGATAFVFKKQVYPKLTVIGSDSLNLWGGVGSPTPFVSPSYVGFGVTCLDKLTNVSKVLDTDNPNRLLIDQMDLHAINQIIAGDTYDTISCKNAGMYIESQFHGIVPTDAIEKIIIYFENRKTTQKDSNEEILNHREAISLQKQINKLKPDVPVFITEIKSRGKDE